jgi:hypothetical protein
MRYWPFLIAANKKFDYRPVICPDFDRSESGELFRKSLDPRSYASEGLLHAAQARHPDVGDLSIFYKTEFLRVPNAPREFVNDDFGRQIHFTYGVVAQMGREDGPFDDRAAERLVDAQRPHSLELVQKLNASPAEPVVTMSRAVAFGERPSPIERPERKSTPASPPAERPPAKKQPFGPSLASTSASRRSGITPVTLLIGAAIIAIGYLAFSATDEIAEQRAELKELTRRLGAIEEAHRKLVARGLPEANEGREDRRAPARD